MMPFAPSDLLTNAIVGGDGKSNAAFEDVRGRHPDVDGALTSSARAGDLLLKCERSEIDKINAYADELSAAERDPFEGAHEAPCAVEASSVRACYSANVSDVTACRDLVEKYRACGRTALRKFIRRERAAA